jgi:hypothetical protein
MSSGAWMMVLITAVSLGALLWRIAAMAPSIAGERAAVDARELAVEVPPAVLGRVLATPRHTGEGARLSPAGLTLGPR